jgi:hypothetical protein
MKEVRCLIAFDGLVVLFFAEFLATVYSPAISAI